MTIHGVHPGAHSHGTAEHRADRGSRASLPKANVGDSLQVQIQRRLGDGRYIASLGGDWHVVRSAMELTVGSTIRATVVSVGERLELRYVEAGHANAQTIAAAPESEVSPADALLDELSSRYVVELSAADRQAIRAAMNGAVGETVVAESGMFLKKLSLPVEPRAMQALQAAQQWSLERAGSPAIAAMTSGSGTTSELARLLLKAVHPEHGDAPGELAASTGEVVMEDAGSAGASADDSGNLGDLARRLLNEQDDGALAYRYGTLPVIVADQLVELDLVHFRERRRRQDPGQPDMQRLVMTFSTATLGRIEVVARAFNDHVSIAISSESARSNATLQSHAAEVRELVARLGWHVDEVAYEINPEPARAARSVVEHVLNAGTLDRLL